MTSHFFLSLDSFRSLQIHISSPPNSLQIKFNSIRWRFPANPTTTKQFFRSPCNTHSVLAQLITFCVLNSVNHKPRTWYKASKSADFFFLFLYFVQKFIVNKRKKKVAKNFLLLFLVVWWIAAECLGYSDTQVFLPFEFEVSFLCNFWLEFLQMWFFMDLEGEILWIKKW